MALLAGPAAAAAETLDRVVASIGNMAITQSDVERARQFELVLNGRLPSGVPDARTLQQVRDRVINQVLLVQEAEAEGVEPGDLTQRATEALAEARKKFATEELFQSALRSLGTDEAGMLKHLEHHERTLWLINQRLRPAAWVEQAEIEAYYNETFVPQYMRRSPGAAPPLADIEAQIREILVQKKIDQLLATWLEELRSSRRVRVPAFEP